MKFDDVVSCLGAPHGRQAPSVELSGISTDTRTLGQGSLFVPLVGEKFDGHDYVEQAVMELGVEAVVWGRDSLPEWWSEDCKVSVFLVPDTLIAYQTLGLYWKKKCQVKAIGVTGSVGKTTTKELLSHFLSESFSVHKSRANFNNDIGVPKTLLEVTPEHEIVIVEMGMRGPGEIARLCRASEPEMGVITAIGTSHMELLGSRDAIARAKGELFESLPESGTAVVPQEDDYCAFLKSLTSAHTVSYSAHPDSTADFRPDSIESQDEEGTSFTWLGVSCRLNLPGRHHLHDLFAAFATARSLGVDSQLLIEALPRLQNPEGRAEWLSLRGARIYLDAYNCAPESLKASLLVLQACSGRRIAVLGDMLELGEQGPQIHFEVGQSLVSYGVDLLLGHGSLTRFLVQGAQEHGLEAYWFADKAELTDCFSQTLGPQDFVLVKASRGMALETVVDAIQEKVG